MQQTLLKQLTSSVRGITNYFHLRRLAQIYDSRRLKVMPWWPEVSLNKALHATTGSYMARLKMTAIPYSEEENSMTRQQFKA
ncbi:hypothetical protein GJ744_009604 [Endocarpon pusillum]|uniref:Uncharacterized protein n=1 Tax=Endocarpon pusillum TaxID=364733 RepID=A0A8H7AFU4_9EURO|nr:hypothetical protein GJ744_009604 [Endocarpon pusillum]